MSRHPRTIFTTGLLALLLAAGTSVQAGQVFVNKYANGLDDGTSWKDAFTNLYHALNVSQPGDSVWVAQGTYYPTSDGTNYNEFFTLKNGVQLIGGFAGVETSASQANWRRHPTYLDGNIGNANDWRDNTRQIIIAAYATNAVLDGFNVVNGSATNHMDIGAGPKRGAGLSIVGAPITVRHCYFRDNHSNAEGGALYTEAGAAITSCVFSNNTSPGLGGAIYSKAANVSIDNSLFVSNRLYTVGNGGAINFQGGHLTMKHCTFLTNGVPNTFGPNLAVLNTGAATVVNCIFWGRAFTNSVIQDQGGGVTVRTTAGLVSLSNCDMQDGYTPPTNASIAAISNINPLFVDFAGRNGRLQSGSPCIDIANPGSSVASDLDGVSRPQGLGPDLGAYEFTTNVPPTAGAATGLTALGESGRVELEWTNPANADFSGVMIVLTRSGAAPLGAPANGHAYIPGDRVADGTVIYMGPGTNPAPSAVSAFVHTNLPPDSTYTYTVYAHGGTTNFSSGITATATTLRAPWECGYLDAIGGDKQIELKWINPADEDEPQGLLILRRFDDRPSSRPTNTQHYYVGDTIGDAEVVYFGFGTNVGSEVETGWINTNLAGSSTYFYHMYTVDGGPNYSDIPTEFEATTFSMVNIDSLSATALQHSAQFRWHNTDDVGFSGVIVLRAEDGPPDTVPANATVYNAGETIGNATVAYRGPGLNGAPNANSGWNETAFLVTTTTYYYAFHGIDALVNYAQPTLYTNITTLVDVTAPGSITNLVADFTGIGEVTLQWTNPGDVDFRNVLIVRKTDPPSAWTPTPGATYAFGNSTPAGTVVYAGPGNNNTPGAANAFQDLYNLSAGQRYYYTVFAYDTANLYSSSQQADAESPPAGVLFVNDDAVAGANNGGSWLNAYTNLQDALAAATESNQIWVAEGTYFPTYGTSTAAKFTLTKPIAIYGGFAGNESKFLQRKYALYPTILSGDIGTRDSAVDNSAQILTTTAGAAGGLLDGFIVEKAYGNANGGGMYVGAVMTVQNCWFRDNYAGESAMFIAADASVRGCRFSGNYATHRGGALQSQGSSPTIVNCLFHDNGTDGAGGSVALYHRPMTFVNCTFTASTCLPGAAICAYISNYGAPTFINCLFNDSGDSGGGIFPKPWNGINESGAVSLYNCFVRGGIALSAYVVVADNIIGGNPGDDPDFEDEAARDLHLKPASMCVDAGTATGAPVDDYDNGTRPVGAGYDIGAYEYGSTGPGTPPTGLIFFVR